MNGILLLAQNSPLGGAICGEDQTDINRAVEAGVLYLCPHGRSPLPDEQLPCGMIHSEDGFYHLCKGKTIEDYDELIA